MFIVTADGPNVCDKYSLKPFWSLKADISLLDWPWCHFVPALLLERKGREGKEEKRGVGMVGRKMGVRGVCNKVRTEGRKREGAGKDGR